MATVETDPELVKFWQSLAESHRENAEGYERMWRNSAVSELELKRKVAKLEAKIDKIKGKKMKEAQINARLQAQAEKESWAKQCVAQESTQRIWYWSRCGR